MDPEKEQIEASAQADKPQDTPPPGSPIEPRSDRRNWLKTVGVAGLAGLGGFLGANSGSRPDKNDNAAQHQNLNFTDISDNAPLAEGMVRVKGWIDDDRLQDLTLEELNSKGLIIERFTKGKNIAKDEKLFDIKYEFTSDRRGILPERVTRYYIHPVTLENFHDRMNLYSNIREPFLKEKREGGRFILEGPEVNHVSSFEGLIRLIHDGVPNHPPIIREEDRPKPKIKIPEPTKEDKKRMEEQKKEDKRKTDEMKRMLEDAIEEGGNKELTKNTIREMLKDFTPVQGSIAQRLRPADPRIIG